MNCIEARRMVTPFIKRELSDKETEQFLKHIEHCSDCMDELDIYFTVYKALDTLDSGMHSEYNFKKLLAEEIRSVRYGVMRRKMLRTLHRGILLLVELLLLLSLYTGYEVRKSETRSSTIHRAIHRLHGGDGTELRGENAGGENAKKPAEQNADDAGAENAPEQNADDAGAENAPEQNAGDAGAENAPE